MAVYVAWPHVSFATDSKLDEVVKRPLIEQTLSVLKTRPSDHR